METNLTEIIKKIRTAVLGREVRSSIADGLEYCGQISENAKADMDATAEAAKEAIDKTAEDAKNAIESNAASVKEQLSKDIDAKAAAALESIPEEYTELDGSVKQLEEDLTDAGTRIYNIENENFEYPLNLYNPDELSVETRVNANGQIESNTDVSTTGYIRATKGDTVYTFRTYPNSTTLSPLTPTYITEFNSSKKFIRRTPQYPTNGTTGQYDITDENVKFIRIENPKGVYTQYSYSVRINYNGDNTYVPYKTPTSKISEIQDILKNVAIKIMSYNVGKFSYGIGNGYADSDTLSEKIKTTKRFFGGISADIIGLQEKKNGFDANNTVDSNIEIFNYLYPYVESRDLSTLAWDVPEIRSKYRISNGGCSKLSTGRNYIYGTVDIYGQNIYLLNVHLDPFSPENRNTERAEILSLLSDKEYFILMGDFNALSGADEFKLFKDAGYNVANSGYFGDFQTTTTEGQCIDNIITSSRIKIENVYVPDYAYKMCSSDHYPIIADVLIS